MTVKRDVLGHRRYVGEPAFQEVEGGFYYHLKLKKLFNKDEFDAKLVADGLTFAVDEVGYASIQYVIGHEDMLNSYVPPAGSAQMNINITKVPSGVDDTGAVTVTGGPTDEPLILRMLTRDSTNSAGSEVPTIVYIPMTGELTLTEVAEKIAAAVYDTAFTSVTSALGVVTFTPSSGGSIAVFDLDLDRPY